MPYKDKEKQKEYMKLKMRQRRVIPDVIPDVIPNLNIYKNIHREMLNRLNIQFIKRTHFPRHKYLFRKVQQQLLMRQLLPRDIYNKKYKNLL